MTELTQTAAPCPPLTLCRGICGQIGITKKSGAFSECFVCYKEKKILSKERNATYRIKVGINGSSFDQSNCLAQGWHRGSKELGCSLLPIQMSHASQELSCCVWSSNKGELLKRSWGGMQQCHRLLIRTLERNQCSLWQPVCKIFVCILHMFRH